VTAGEIYLRHLHSSLILTANYLAGKLTFACTV
jgi:hypothetical protein